MEKIQRLAQKEYDLLIAGREPIGAASSTSLVYNIKGGLIIKDLNDKDLDDIKDESKPVYTESELLKFSDIESKYYYFVKGVIYVDDVLRAAVMKKCRGYVLTLINVLSVNLTLFMQAINRFDKETLKISQNHIKGFDMRYNFMYDGVNFGAIDTNEYEHSILEDENKIYLHNIKCFNEEAASFLVDFYFYEFVSQDLELFTTYKAILDGESTDLIEFVKLFKIKLSEYCGKRIAYLSDAKKAVRKNKNPKYPVCPLYSLSRNSKKQQFIN